MILKEKCLKEEEDKIKGEIDIMKKVKHPNCIAFHEMYESKEKLYIVMELVTGALLLLYYIIRYILSEAPKLHCLARDVRVEREALYIVMELVTSLPQLCCCFAAALLLLYCCFTASSRQVSPSFSYGFTAALPLLYSNLAVSRQVSPSFSYCCFTAALLLLYCELETSFPQL